MENKAKKVLIVEDDRAIRRAMEFQIGQKYAVVTADNGEEGLAQAASQKPDLILLDLIMPKMGGFEALKQLKEDPVTKNIPVIIFSNLSQETDVEQAKKMGAVDFYVKSDLSIDELMEKIDKYIN